MAGRSFIQTSKNQQGVVLLVLLIAIVLASASYLLSGLSLNQVKIEQKTQTRIVLKKAKQALIAHAVTRADRIDEGLEGEIGYLPCPDWNTALDEGKSDGNCGNAQTNAVGYFPWVSLDTPIFWDNSGSCLWYAISGSYKNPNSSVRMINEDSNGLFQIMDDTNTVIVGNNPEDRIVAVIFAPGEQLTGQARVLDGNSFCGKDYGNVTAYLEGNGTINNGAFDGGTDAIDQFIHASNASATEATPYNDQFITITRDEIWDAILTRSDFNEKMRNLTEALAVCLSQYSNMNRLPWVAPMNMADYRININYDDSDGTIGFAGRYPFIVETSNNNLGIDSADNEIFTDAGCDNLTLPTAGINNVDLVAGTSEYKILWDNWKDHFFYVASEDYVPDELSATVEYIVVVKEAIDLVLIEIVNGDEPAATLQAGIAAAAVINAVASATAATDAANALPATTPQEIEVANSEINSASDMSAVVADINDAVDDITAAALVLDVAAANAVVTNADNAVSAAITVAVDDPTCLPASTLTVSPINCIKVDVAPLPVMPASERAGMVIYSGSRQDAQLRTGAVGVDANTKQLISNYLENNNNSIFPDNTGNGEYETVGAGSSDIMFCIQTDMSVVECL